MTENTTKIAFLATDGYEDSELTSPWEAVTQAGATATLIAPESGSIEGKKGHQASVDFVVKDANPDDFAGLVLPGGVVNADHLRMDDDAVAFVKSFFDANKPVAVICHGGWILTDADVLSGRTLTSYPSLKTDLKNAGATWVDEEVCVDGELISSRTPNDLPAFNREFVQKIRKN
ncbi:peptidase C56 [Bowdeniella nasicola]|uniref:Peptidase C56 n=1 Tax=Bowdeniella nasicola TaxID=208480 RepID=A0A1Q5Q3N6_9ACTO|nr:type 1 glutamine amidotransferase domain-containing protein [Bowdeniella nasicola]OKL54421.1 peptidase C56 [Bowdeniella nasicola]